MLLSRRFINNVLRNSEFGKRVLSVVVDEAHVVSHWGASFRKKYGSLGMIRAFLPRGTPIVAMSATLPARIREDVLSKLQFGRDYLNVDEGNDQPNVSIIVRGIQHPLNTYADLDFVIGVLGNTDPKEIRKNFIYADNIATGVEIIDHLISLLPPELQTAGIIRPYNATFSHAYRKEVMHLFRLSEVRILVCTDAAGMGCNIPDIDVVVQWKLPGSVSMFVQRAGRAGRGKGTMGLGVMLVEQSAFGVDLLAAEEPSIIQESAGRARSQGRGGQSRGQGRGQGQGRGRGRGGARPGSQAADTIQKTAKQKKMAAEVRGAKRGSRGGLHDAILIREQPLIDPNASDEGLHVLVQTGTCRRLVLQEIFGNKRPCKFLESR
jgi:hypothetical protein